MLRHLGLSLLRGYARIAPTERGGYRLARLARRLVPRSHWRDVFPTGHGVRLELDLSTYPDVAMAAGLYELDTVRLLRKLLKPGMHFVDGGANIGFFSCRAARLVGPTGRVDAFEPDPFNRRRLEENLARNGFVEAVHVHPLAISDRAETLTFHRPAAGTRRNHGETSRFPPPDVITEPFEVTAARLDEALDRVPDLVKLDLEGSEPLALAGARGWIASDRPPTWIIEHNPEAGGRAGHRPGDLWRTLHEIRRYTCTFLGSMPAQFLAAPEDLDELRRHGNLLFVPFPPQEHYPGRRHA